VHETPLNFLAASTKLRFLKGAWSKDTAPDGEWRYGYSARTHEEYFFLCAPTSPDRVCIEIVIMSLCCHPMSKNCTRAPVGPVLKMTAFNWHYIENSGGILSRRKPRLTLATGSIETYRLT
jgi:hypothetical protein